MRTLRIGWVAGLVVLASTCVASATRYYVIDMGMMGTSSAGWRVNNAAQATGSWYSTAGRLGFLYDQGQMADLGTLGGAQAFANDINAAGVVVGQSFTGTGASQAFVYKEGSITPIAETLGGTGTAAYGINAAGVIVGSSTTTAGATHAFTYSNGVMTDLGIAGGYNLAKAINKDGVVAGEYGTMTGVRAFTLKNGQLTDLGTPTGAYVTVNDISDSGIVVGTAALGGPLQGFYYDGQIHKVGTLGGFTSQANGINSAGQIVGASFTALGAMHGFVFENGQIVDLNGQLAYGAGWTILSAGGISDKGDIVGTGIINGEAHAVLLQPVPLPSSVLMGLGLLMCVGFATMYRRIRHAE